ncbi:hypothetical protein [Sphingobacterium sp. UDSM-2020]|uniref:hypothetical protein n=1 Tax=Sphingobacterium sp. UDSM-2020 TaxID=2795738 RepID=UPI0019357602|nr:hypothetical protein [Sphingobacterium sp. UDSM-2020]QQD15452.1 hypothetical protein JAZ75_08045 [Sphingobacterium sp. UDSM-2020]
MNEKRLQKKRYEAPKIGWILIEMESCFGFYPEKLSYEDKLEIKSPLTANKIENNYDS